MASIHVGQKPSKSGKGSTSSWWHSVTRGALLVLGPTFYLASLFSKRCQKECRAPLA